VITDEHRRVEPASLDGQMALLDSAHVEQVPQQARGPLHAAHDALDGAPR
jgi:hypothetical protein